MQFESPIVESESSIKKILIISYVFPPHPGIGGRRWAKFAKYLSIHGFEVHVIYAKSKEGGVSVWIDDVVRDPNIHLHPVTDFYPEVLNRIPVSITEKIKYRLWKKVLELKFNGYIYDKTIFSASSFVKMADKIITGYNISKVIVTGAPFRLVHAISINRKRWKDIHLTVDFRDPWTWEESGSFQQLSESRLSFEKNMEREVIVNADMITVPTLPMKMYLESTYKDADYKFAVLPHAWDEEEIKVIPKKNKLTPKLILYGTLYPGIENKIRLLAKALVDSKSIITLDIFSDTKSYQEIFREEGASHLVCYFEMLPSRQLYRTIHNYIAAVIINNDSDKDHVSTKFIELAASGTPVIYIASAGKAAEFVVKYNSGWHTDGSTLRSILEVISHEDYVSPISDVNLENLTFYKVSERFINQAYHMVPLAEANHS